MNKLSLLTVCRGNSSRSIMAEALFKKYGKDLFEVCSGGSAATGAVHPKTTEILQRHAIDTSLLHSKSWNEFSTRSFDLVLTVSAEGLHDPHPLFPGRPARLVWGLADPEIIRGNEAEIDAGFEEVFYELRDRVQEFCRDRRGKCADAQDRITA